MGFKVGRIYVLEFEGTGMEGAVVKVKSPSIATVEALPEMDTPEVYAAFFEHLTEWNLEREDGTPLPLSLAAAREVLEPTALALITRSWYEAARGVTAPLDPRTIRQRLSNTGSEGGEPSPEAESTELSIPMETL